MRYECFVPKKIDKVGNYVISKITKEEEIMRLYSNIVTSLKSLVKMNLHFFLNVYIISIPVTNLLEKQILQDFY